MTPERPGPPQSVPTLTEVIEWPLAEQSAEVPAQAPEMAPPGDVARSEAIDEAELVRRILQGLKQQIEGVLEYRIREALTPILSRAADALVRDARHELSRSLGDLVNRAVAEELRRQRPGRADR